MVVRFPRYNVGLTNAAIAPQAIIDQIVPGFFQYVDDAFARRYGIDVAGIGDLNLKGCLFAARIIVEQLKICLLYTSPSPRD